MINCSVLRVYYGCESFRVPGPTELPYVTEAGSKALDYMWAIYISQLRLINPDIQLPQRRLIDMSKLVTDVINLLLGLPSACFTLDMVSISEFGNIFFVIFTVIQFYFG